MPTADYSASPYDIVIVKGDDYEELFSFSGQDGEPMDLSAYEFSSKLRETDGDLVATFTCDKVTAEGDDFPTRVRRTLSSEFTSGLDGDYVHDFQWEVNGRIRTFLGGTFHVEPEVTY